MRFNPNRHALPPGRALHWYTIHDVLGQGGFGITYLAHDPNLNQPVAIKEYLPTGLAVRESDDSVQPASDKHCEGFRWGLERFLTEAQTLSRFEHPNIVRVLTIFEMNGTAYMVMRYEDGRSLEEMLPAQATLEESWLKRTIFSVIDGLALVHADGFIHRDIKPGNLFIREDDTPVLIDFGSARQAMGRATHTLTTLVSPGYAPFEQYYARSDRQGPWTDVYGLGATLYRAVTGEMPLDALERSESLLRTGRDNYVPAAERVRDRYDPAFLAAIDRALSFRERDRPQTLSIWARELRGEVSISAPAVTAVQSATAQPTPLNVAATPTTPISTRPVASGVLGRHRQRFAILGSIALMAIIFSVALRPGEPDALPSDHPRVSFDAGQEFSEQAEHGPDGPELGDQLAGAWDDLADMRLAGPDGDNAAARYARALEVDPHNREALSGLQTIYDYYMARGRRAARAGDFTEARSHMEDALGVAPNPAARARAHKRLTRLRG